MPRYSRTQLAERSGVPARTIRYYHSLGLLPKPGRAGKAVVYDDQHLERLRDIAAMQARGLRLDAIGEIFATDAPPPADWRTLFDPRTPVEGTTIDDDALTELLGDRRPEILDELITAQYLERRGDQWHIPDQPMLTGALILYDIGTDIALSRELRIMIRHRIAELADDIVRAFRDAVGTSYGGQEISGDLSRFRDRLRAAAREVGGATLADEIERAARELDERAASSSVGPHA
ncbi:MerR family transcriptional regulator [Nocardia donostiensis]|uniref:Transcriptional regulator n=1 Tax=Nocardia donostiensis TaxID=1538463 RepID=A0A1V2TA83_9NOCA|nr:MerR family transcriptional regulator [Nocardia donostiensis]ONM46423.1 transcriptional regulator [Nocardia donostiensis]OQS16287.1 transcriptional regulator [Nocardia donostiensis]OQS17034.1 transcriptional regulator [Nocardia donostiensis]